MAAAVAEAEAEAAVPAPGVDEALLRKKMGSLDASSNSIMTLSHWCVFYEKYAGVVVSHWRREVMNPASGGEKLTALLYLANDIMQNCRRKGLTRYIDCFYAVMGPSLESILSRAPDVRRRVERLVNIWVERRVFGTEHGKALLECVRPGQPEEAPAGAGAGAGAEPLAGFSPVREADADAEPAPDEPPEQPQPEVADKLYTELMQVLSRHCSRVSDCAARTARTIAEDGEEGEPETAAVADALSDEIVARGALMGALEGLLEEQRKTKASLEDQQRRWTRSPFKRARHNPA